MMDEAIRPICANCEYWDAGGEAAARTALTGDCLNHASDRFTPERNHSCKAFYPDTGRWPDGED
jgi:hypothetical protein